MSTALYFNCSIYTPADSGKPQAGSEQGRLLFWQDGALCVEDGLIRDVGNQKEVLSRMKGTIDRKFDCGGRCMIPGFVDPHTHMCFAERREAEFELRLAGTPYLEILRQGGGILSSVRAVAAAGEEELYGYSKQHVLSALAHGTTTLEIKSGYGLDTENELKMLRVIRKLDQTLPPRIVPTFLGAHAIPKQFKTEPNSYIDLIIEEMMPAVKDEELADQCDIFCEKDVFTIQQSRRLLKAAKAVGMKIKIHADEVHDLGGGGLAADLGALSADHLLAVNDENIQKMSTAGVIATLLPGTAYSLKKTYARARAMIEANLPVALATDCNPGSSYTESMPFIIGLAVMNMDMSPAEALTAATLNSAYAIDMAKAAGSLDLGKQADFLLLDGESPAILAYHGGVSPVKEVYIAGKKVNQ
jgi:imidazolonepropionase